MTEQANPKSRRGKKNADDYIEHEPLGKPSNEQQDTTTVTVEAEEVTPEAQLKNEVVKLKLSDSAIAELKEQYGGLEIAGPDDKAGYKAVKAAWSDVRSVRTGLEKRGLEIRNRISIVTKGVKKEEDRLVDLITPLEQDLQRKWKEIDDAKEALERKRQEEEQAQLMKRLEELVSMGMKLENGFYRIGETISMDVATLRALPEEQFQTLKQTVQAKVDEITLQARLKAQEEEKERLKLEQEMAQLQRDRDKLEQERQEILAQRRELRVGKLEALGFQLTTAGGPENMFFRRLAFNVGKVLEMTVTEFNEFFREISENVRVIKEQEVEEKRLKERVEVRMKQLLDLGLTYNPNMDQFMFDNGYRTVQHKGSTLLDLDDYGFAEHAKILGDNIREAKFAKEQHEKNVAEEKQVLEQKKNSIAELLQNAGMSFNFKLDQFEFINPQGKISATWNELLPLGEANLKAKVLQLTSMTTDLINREKEAQIKKADQEKKDKLVRMKDKERWDHTLEDLEAAHNSMMPDEFKTKAYKDKATQLYLELSTLVNKYR